MFKVPTHIHFYIDRVVTVAWKCPSFTTTTVATPPVATKLYHTQERTDPRDNTCDLCCDQAQFELIAYSAGWFSN